MLQDTRTRQNRASKQRLNHKSQLEVLRARREARDLGQKAPSLEHSPSIGEEEGYCDPFAVDEDIEEFISESDDLEVDRGEVKDLLPLHSIISPEEAFEMVVEWLIHKRLAPSFDAHAQRYQMALRKLDDQAATFGGSKFSSSAWRPDFQRALNARPYLKDKSTGILYSDTCQACGRSSHPATWHMRFYGSVYNRVTLEPLDEEDEEFKDYDIDGNPIVSEEYQFSLGK